MYLIKHKYERLRRHFRYYHECFKESFKVLNEFKANNISKFSEWHLSVKGLISPDFACLDYENHSFLRCDCQPKCKIKCYTFVVDLISSRLKKEFGGITNKIKSLKINCKQLKKDLLACLQDLAGICKILNDVITEFFVAAVYAAAVKFKNKSDRLWENITQKTSENLALVSRFFKSESVT